MISNTLLISIKPRYAEKIFQGNKKVELRKTKPRLSKGDTVIVYVSSPIKELQGSFKVVKVVKDSIEKLWLSVGIDAGISKEEFLNYYENSNIGYGIVLEEAELVKVPLGLNQLRLIWSGFHPPQCYKYLNLKETNLIKRHTDNTHLQVV